VLCADKGCRTDSNKDLSLLRPKAQKKKMKKQGERGGGLSLCLKTSKKRMGVKCWQGVWLDIWGGRFKKKQKGGMPPRTTSKFLSATPGKKNYFRAHGVVLCAIFQEFDEAMKWQKGAERTPLQHRSFEQA